MFFEGSVAEAILASRRELRPLVVLLTGFDQGSRQVQDALIEQAGTEWAQACIVLALEDDLANTDRGLYTDAKNFRAFCPVEQLPTVLMVGPSGATLAKVAGVVPAAELQRQLAEAYAAYRHQQQRLMAAQAALMAAHAASGAAGAAAVSAPPPAALAAALPSTPAASAAAVVVAQQAVAMETDTAQQAAGTAGTAGSDSDDPDMPELEDEPIDFAAAHLGAGSNTAGPQRTSVLAAVAAATGGAAMHSAPAAEVPPPDPATVPYKLQFKFTDATSFRATFTGATLLSEVFGAIDAARQKAGRAPLAYVLVQAQPRRVLGAADEGLTLAAAGVPPMTSLQVIPHAAQGHRPPAPPAPEPATSAQAEDVVMGEQQQTSAGQEDAVAAAPVGAAPRHAAGAQLQVRLSNGSSLQRTFGPHTKLATVLDWIDAERTDRGAYKLTQPHPKRTFFSGDLGSSLQELGLQGRVALVLELLPAKPKPKPKPKPAPPAEPKLPDVFDLQFKLTNGEQLRGSFAPDALLQQVCHHLDTHRTDGGAPYTLVQPYPKRRFTLEDMQQPLLDLGLQQRQLLLLEPVGAPRREPSSNGWSLGGALSAAAGYLNPLGYLRGSAGTPREAQAQQRAEETAAVASAAAAAAERRLGRGGPSGEAGDVAGGSGGSGAGLQQRSRKRALGSGGGANIHTLGRGGDAGADDGEGGNQYWNGNSTEFGGVPPPDPQ